MIKRMKRVVAMVLIIGVLTDTSLINAASTAGGTLGKTAVDCSIGINGGASTYSQAYLRISTENKVEKLGIKNINIVKKDGGGETGKSTYETDAYSASYTGNTYAPSSIKSISATFYVTSTNFGNFSKNMSY